LPDAAGLPLPINIAVRTPGLARITRMVAG
jgi:hypothetical protein